MGSPAGVFQELQRNTAKDIEADSGTFAGGWGAGFQPFLSSAAKKTGCVSVTEGVWLFPSVLLRFSLLPGSACVHRFCPLPVPGISLQFDFLPGAVQRPAAACELCKRSHLTSSPSPELSPSPGEVAEFVSERP